jgi:hypothetical protein
MHASVFRMGFFTYKQGSAIGSAYLAAYFDSSSDMLFQYTYEGTFFSSLIVKNALISLNKQNS